MLIFFTVGLSSVQASVVAVFPVEDLSRGVNSPNFEMTRYLAEELAARGVGVAREDDVLSFMAAERVRWLGYLDTEHMVQAKKSLGVDLILFGTICQRDATNSPSFGLTLNLVRTMDAKTVWSASGGLSLADLQRLLGLNEPATLEELWPILVKEVLAAWPADIGLALNEPLIFDSEAGELPPTLQVKKISMSPRYVKPGEQIKCVVELNTEGEAVESPQVFIKVGNRVHLAQQSHDSLFYEAAWTGSEIEKGIFREVGHEALKLAATDLDPKLFEGVWEGSEEDDVFPVSLVLRWPNADQQIAFIGNYTVDSTPPDINMSAKGMLLDGMVTFRDEIFILPKAKVNERFSHWQIWVEDKTGALIMGDEGDGKLPAKLRWQGQKYNGFPAEEGLYRLRLKVWDRAGNESETSQDVVYRPNPPNMILDVEKAGDALQISIDKENKEMPLSFWTMEIWNENGQLLKTADGQELPAYFTIPLISDDGIKIGGRVSMRDILGNKTQVDIGDLYLLALRKENSQDQETSEADEEDDDSWAWLSEN